MKIIIFANYKVSDDILNRIVMLLYEAGFEVINIYKEMKDVPKEHDADMVLSIGGDGTLLKAVYLFSPTPILPINYLSVGAVIETEIEEINSAIERLKNGDYELEQIDLLKGELDYGEERKDLGIALNEFLVIKKVPGRAFKAEIFINDKKVGILRGDGFIIATPVGSTGHSFSVGGSVIHPELKALIFTPIAPLYRKFAPIVLPYSSIISAKILCDSLIVADGSRIFEAKENSMLRFSISNKKAYLVRFLSSDERIVMILKKILNL